MDVGSCQWTLSWALSSTAARDWAAHAAGGPWGLSFPVRPFCPRPRLAVLGTALHLGQGLELTASEAGCVSGAGLCVLDTSASGGYQRHQHWFWGLRLMVFKGIEWFLFQQQGRCQDSYQRLFQHGTYAETTEHSLRKSGRGTGL